MKKEEKETKLHREKEREKEGERRNNETEGNGGREVKLEGRDRRKSSAIRKKYGK